MKTKIPSFLAIAATAALFSSKALIFQCFVISAVPKKP